MIKQSLVAISVSLGLAVAGNATAADTVVIEEPEVRTIVMAEGYGEPIVVSREQDMWRVRTTDSDSDGEVTVFVNAQGQLLGASEVVESRITQTTTTTIEREGQPESRKFVTSAEVANIVSEAGFHNVHDIDFLDRQGVWKAEADDITGEDFALHVDPMTGDIVHIEDD